jgi:hypothetical protein
MTRSSRIILVAVLVASALAAAVAVPALTTSPTATSPTAMPATAVGKTIYACLTARHTLSRVSVTKPPTCPAGTVPVQWEGLAGQPVPSPSASPTSTTAAPTPSPTVTSPTATSPPSQSPTGAACVTSSRSGSCGPYDYPQISNSNGWTTYVGNNMWACGDGTCGPQTLTAYDPGSWSVVSNQTAGNSAVRTYPNVQQIFTKTTNVAPRISAFASITSDYTETMNETPGTIAQAAYDIWLSDTPASEVMIWVDNAGRGDGGATRIGAATVGGKAFTVYRYGSDELIFSLDQNLRSGTIDVLGVLRWLQDHGLVSATAGLAQIDFGWEICSTGGQPEKFAVSRFTLTSKCGPAGGCFG